VLLGLGQPSLEEENFPQKSKIFPLFTLMGKKNLFGSGQKISRLEMRQPLMYCESDVCTGRVWSGSSFRVRTKWAKKSRAIGQN